VNVDERAGERSSDGKSSAEGATGGESSGSGEDSAGAARLERAVVAVSVLVVAAMFGYVLWQAATTPGVADPVPSVERVEPVPGTDRQRVTVGVENHGGVGLTSVQVGVRCGNIERELEFTHIPTGGSREGVVVCPAGEPPEVAVETWVAA
jgi:hypothetical protein